VADALSRLPQYTADVKSTSVPAASNSKARSKAKDSPVGEEEAAIIHLGYLASIVRKQCAVVDEVDSDDELPSLFDGFGASRCV